MLSDYYGWLQNHSFYSSWHQRCPIAKSTALSKNRLMKRGCSLCSYSTSSALQSNKSCTREVLFSFFNAFINSLLVAFLCFFSRHPSSIA
eukprot:m.260448 g.260448  ORF g.260448 m.260448 type:complete len:90 (+) comp40435_c0_seq50:20-289(+)